MRRRTKTANMPEPIPDLTKDEFNKLQKEWYTKLRRSGFKDIEFFERVNGKLEPTVMTSSFKYTKRAQATDTYNHFRLCKNYANYGKILPKWHRFVLHWYADGMSYRKIRQKFNETAWATQVPIAVKKRRKARFARNIALKRPFKFTWMYTNPGPIETTLVVHKLIKYLIKNAIEFNKTHEEGLLNPNAVDFNSHTDGFDHSGTLYHEDASDWTGGNASDT